MVSPDSGQALQNSVQISVSPASATVRAGNSRQFTATVQNSSNKAESWNVNGVAGGNSIVGNIGYTGLYKAPKTVPSSSTVNVTAVSAADPSKSARALLKITGK